MMLDARELREELKVDKILVATIKDDTLKFEHSFDDKNFSLLQLVFLVLRNSIFNFDYELKILKKHPNKNVKLLIKLLKDARKIDSQTIFYLRDLAIKNYSATTCIYRAPAFKDLRQGNQL